MANKLSSVYVFFFQAEDGIRDDLVTGVQTCALPISPSALAGIAPAPVVQRFQRRLPSARKSACVSSESSAAACTGSDDGAGTPPSGRMRELARDGDACPQAAARRSRAQGDLTRV